MEDVQPPLKRRRTSQDDSDSSRPQSRDATLAYRANQQSTLSGHQKQQQHDHDDSTRRYGHYDEDRRTTSSRRSRGRSHSSDYRNDAQQRPRSRNRDRRSTSRTRSKSRSRSRTPRSRSRSDSRSQSRSRRRRDLRSHSRSSSQSDSFHSARANSVSEPDLNPDTEMKITSKKTLSFKSLHTLPRAHARGITCVKFSPDHSLLAVGSADATISIYTISIPSSTGSQTSPALTLLRTLRAHLAGINAIAWSPIGPNYALASASDDKSILLWSPLSSDFPINPSPLQGHSNYVYSLAFSPKGNMLVSGSYDEAVFLWDVRSARVMRTLPAHSDPVSGVDFLRDGSMVCSCASDGLIRIWDSGTGQCLKTLVDEDRKPVTSVRFSPNGKFVLGWGLDGCIRLWLYTEGRCVKTYMGHVNEEYSLGGTIGDYDGGKEAFVVSGSEDGDVVVWDVQSKNILWRGKGHRDVVLSVDFARDPASGRGMLVSAGKDRDVRLWIEEGDDAKFTAAMNRVNGTLKMEDSADEEMIAAANADVTDDSRVMDEEADADGDIDMAA